MITPDAQKMASDLNYAPLPTEVVALIQSTAAHPQGCRQDNRA